MVKKVNIDKKDVLLYAITDRQWLNGKTLASQVEEVLKMEQLFYSFVKNTLNMMSLSEKQLQ